MRSDQNETFTRVQIDSALKYNRWNLLDPRGLLFEIRIVTGRTGYFLELLGRVLCALKAKREVLDSYDAKEQARG